MGEISQSIKVNGLRINALLDSGATENYLSESVAKRLKLPIGKKYQFKGIDGIRNTGYISYITTEIMHRAGSTRVIITNILPQDGYDIILGQTFLQDNEIILNFKKDKFRFSKHQPQIRRIGRI